LGLTPTLNALVLQDITAVIAIHRSAAIIIECRCRALVRNLLVDPLFG
jgi:hypothetical protein